ncbi:CrcB family protein [Haloarcula sp. 1CSR25-25]|uniref:fluoride efflux transporter FluC n=1 Tax=Haloarcula sp. 1CSR25-25 TaxID=2862545 RepID=UPI00289425D1|nr:CrcB family protein [Haloarcula sp. 1CSR25-25]MDT3433625.1 CrcB family protein [Haloarcula sp. 1CSR25-25]
MADAHPLVTVETVVLVGLGGFAGSNLRYFVGLFFPGLQGTLLVNVLGSFALGVLVYEGLQVGVLASETKLAASTGFISSFTTYSTFAVETALTPEWAVANVVGSYALGFAGVLVGRTAVRLFAGGER